MVQIGNKKLSQVFINVAIRGRAGEAVTLGNIYPRSSSKHSFPLQLE
jgi:hypothetical protein